MDKISKQHIISKITKRKRNDELEIVVYDIDSIFNKSDIHTITGDDNNDNNNDNNNDDMVVNNPTVKVSVSLNITRVKKPPVIIENLDEIPNITGDYLDKGGQTNQNNQNKEDITCVKNYNLDEPHHSDYFSSDSEMDDDTHYLAILPVGDYIYMRNNPVSNNCKKWLYNIYTLTTYNNSIFTLPLTDIDDNFKYKPYIKKIMKQRWNISKNTIHTIKHVFTKKNVHFYLTFLRHRSDNLSIKNSINVSVQDEFCWKDYLIMIPSSTPKPKIRPYLLEYPNNMKMDKHHLYFQGKPFGCGLEQVFNIITKSD